MGDKPLITDEFVESVMEKAERPLSNEQRMRNLARAAQDIRTLLETPRSHESEGRIWRAFYFLDGFLRMVTLSQVTAADGFGALVRVRHDFPVPKGEIGGPYETPEGLAVWLGLDSVPDGHVEWTQDKTLTHSKGGKIVIPMQHPYERIPQS